MGELIAGKSMSCRSCASTLKALRTPKEVRVARARNASSAAAAAQAERVRNNPYLRKYGPEYTRLRRLGASVRQRCSNPNGIGYSNYGGRGIRWEFPSVQAFAEWVLDHLGPRPGEAYSLDRIDNDRGYEPGNLRWATRAEQARNKRAYKRTQNGERIRRLHAERPDLTYETIRLWIVQGRSDAEIIKGIKYARASV